MTNRQLGLDNRLTAFHFLSRVDLGRCELVSREWSTHIGRNAFTLPLYSFLRLDMGSAKMWKKITKGKPIVEQFHTKCTTGVACKWELFACVTPKKDPSSTHLIAAGDYEVSADRKRKREGLHDLVHFLADATPSDRVYFAEVDFGHFPMDLLHYASLQRKGIRCGRTTLYCGSLLKDPIGYPTVSSYAFLYSLLHQPLEGWNRLGSGGFRTEKALVKFHFNEYGEDRFLVDLLLRGGHFCRRRLVVDWGNADTAIRDSFKYQDWLDVVTRAHHLAITDMSEEIKVKEVFLVVSPGARELKKGPHYTQFRGAYNGIVLRLFESSFEVRTRGHFGKNSSVAENEQKRGTKRKGVPLV